MRVHLLASSALTLLLAIPAAGFATQGPEWDIDRGPITFRLHSAGSDDVDDGSDLEALRDAFQAWSCVDGSGIRFVEGPELTEKDDTLVQNEVHVIFDEVGQFGLAPEAQSQSFMEAFFPDQFSVRDAAVIVFNGANFSWSSTGFNGGANDIRSFAIIELAVVLGLDRPCDANGENCLGPDVSVLGGLIPSTGFSSPGSDDADGLRSLYAVDDNSSCEGPFRVGESCACNADCVEGNICAPAFGDELICTPTCDSDDADCAIGFGCLMAINEDGEGSRGFCAKRSEDGLPIGTTCRADSDCTRGLCIPVNALARNVCRVSCDADADCEDDNYTCTDGACVYSANVDGELCETGCACAASETRPSGVAGWALLILVALFARRRT